MALDAAKFGFATGIVFAAFWIICSALIVVLPIGQGAVIWRNVGERFVWAYLAHRGAATGNGANIETRLFKPLPPDSIRIIVRYDDPAFEKLTGCSMWSDPIMPSAEPTPEEASEKMGSGEQEGKAVNDMSGEELEQELHEVHERLADPVFFQGDPGEIRTVSQRAKEIPDEIYPRQ